MATTQRLIRIAVFVGVCCGWWLTTRALPAGPARPDFARVQRVVAEYFAKLSFGDASDLITSEDVAAALRQVEAAGWKVPDGAAMVKSALSDDDPLVRILRSDEGRRFARRVANEKLIFDRLDRISHESGGEELLRSLVKLPDGYRYAPLRPERGLPNLLDFLPKKADGKTRTIKDYEKPTGRIYTVEQLMGRLKASYEGKTKSTAGPSTGTWAPRSVASPRR